MRSLARCALSVAALLLLLVAAVDASRKPPLPVPASQRSFTPMADADGITRTFNACQTPDGYTCEICCDGVCCEDVAKGALLPSNTQMWIPLRFILITSEADRTITEADVAFQLDVLNRAFANTSFRFYKESYEKFTDATMIASCNTDPCYTHPESCSFYHYTLPKVMRSPEWVVNVVVCAIPYYGEAQFPWATVEESNKQYIQVSNRSFANWGISPHDGGKTLIHEMGHYLGLLHVFESKISKRCDVSGDYVSDTAPAAIQAEDWQVCGHPLDSCPELAGHDDTNNFMNYAGDDCMAQFTTGQVQRMERAVALYRPQLFSNRRSMGTCSASGEAKPVSGGSCVCTVTPYSPESFCTSTDPTPRASSPLPVLGNDPDPTPPPTNEPTDPPTLSPPVDIQGNRSNGNVDGEDNGTGLSNVALMVVIILGVLALIAILIGVGVFLAIRLNNKKQKKIQNTIAERRQAAVPAPGARIVPQSRQPPNAQRRQPQGAHTVSMEEEEGDVV